MEVEQLILEFTAKEKELRKQRQECLDAAKLEESYIKKRDLKDKALVCFRDAIDYMNARKLIQKHTQREFIA